MIECDELYFGGVTCASYLCLKLIMKEWKISCCCMFEIRTQSDPFLARHESRVGKARVLVRFSEHHFSGKDFIMVLEITRFNPIIHGLMWIKQHIA